MQDAAVAQGLVGRGDGRPADVERDRELALGGHPHLQGEPTVEHQQPDAVGECGGDAAAAGGAPVAEQPGEAAGADAALDVVGVQEVHPVHSCAIGPG